MKKKSGKKKTVVLLVIVALVACLGFFGYQYAERELIYPLKYQDLIVKYADEYDLDPNFVAAVICTESRFDSEAVSNKGAMGLMQIMPSTGEWIAGKLQEDENFTEQDLFDPEISVRYGCWYLDFLNKRYAGDQTLILAGYNAGIGNVAKWLDNTQYSNDGKTLSAIPADETENYVKKVSSAYEKYKNLYDL